MQQLQQGDGTAFEPLYERYIDQAVRVAYLITRSQEAAEDVVQETFVQVLRRITTLRDPENFRSWFYAILHNTARKSLRKGRGWLLLPFTLNRKEEIDHVEPLPEEAVAHLDEVAQLRRVLRLLPDSHRIPLILRYYAGLSEAQIAEAIGVPAGTVKSRLHHARQKLLDLLEANPMPTGGISHAER